MNERKTERNKYKPNIFIAIYSDGWKSGNHNNILFMLCRLQLKMHKFLCTNITLHHTIIVLKAPAHTRSVLLSVYMAFLLLSNRLSQLRTGEIPWSNGSFLHTKIEVMWQVGMKKLSRLLFHFTFRILAQNIIW